MMTGVFASNAINSSAKGWLIDGNSHQMLIQFYDVAAVFVYCGVGHLHHPQGIDSSSASGSPEVEIEGLDINLHGETVHD